MTKTLARLKIPILFFLIASIPLAFLIYPQRHRLANKLRSILGNHIGPRLRGSGTCENCAKLFPDNVKTHQRAYVREGINQQADDDGIHRLFKKGRLVEINSTDLFTVNELSHSKPYILPKGAAFIRLLAKNYRKKCETDLIDYVPFAISSVTRSRESVKRLGAVNKNSIENSAHLKGKTFDINYRAFNKNKKQNKAFIKVLNDLRLKGKCYVKYERNGCLHITVI